MWFGLLGPLQVKLGDRELPVSSARLRALLASLLFTPGQLVPSARLAELVWDDDPPSRSAITLRSYIKRLRQVLGPAGSERIVTGVGGYLIRVADDEFDITQYGALCARAEAAGMAGAWEQAVELVGCAQSLWRGCPLADISCRAMADVEVPRLEQLRLQATQWRIEAELQLGHYGKVLPELRALTAEHPLREPFHGQLMTALFRSGCQADALAAFRRARRILVSEIGVEPGPELQLLHQRILGGDHDLAAAPSAIRRAVAASFPPAPRHLPPPVLNFAGRAAELAQLTGLLRQKAALGGTTVAVIGGQAGVGKTTLAVHWAHQVANSFPDGQLYLNLNGFGPAGPPLAEADAVSSVLEALAVPAARVPASLAGRIRLYRTLLAERRVLIVLDNAKDADQVRPLLPGGAGCLVVVTSRSPLTSLVALEGASALMLDVLSEPDARQLVAQRLGAARTPADHVATDQLITACARLPLALAIATALVATRSWPSLATIAATLANPDRRLDTLTAGDQAADLRAVFDWSYQALTGPAARLFRLLAEHPGPDISVAAAASLVGLSRVQARESLAELAGLHLLSETSCARFAFHDLLRLYASEQLRALDSQTERQAAAERMLDHYLVTAANAARAISPTRDQLDLGSPAAGAQPEELTGEMEATAWLKAEHQVIMRMITYAAQAGFDTHAWQLPWALTDFLERRGHWHDYAASQRIALSSAVRLGDLAAQAHAHRYIGRACWQLQDLDLALDHLGQALELRRRLAEPTGEAGVSIDLCRVHEQRGRPDEALRCAQRGLSLYRSAQHRLGEAAALNSVGWYNAQLGTYTEAIRCCTSALELARQLGYRAAEGNSWHSLGYIHQQTGDLGQAAGSYRRAIDIFRQLSDRHSEATALIDLGQVSLAMSDLAATRRSWRQALAILDALDHPDGDQLRAHLAALPKAP
jgi:DNA-binding SARP family transcriptional activator/tetratricopeptide (TPR) repeat protein